MASITVQVGKEEKEISGLTRRTTCRDVLLALLSDKKAELQASVEQGEEITLEDRDIVNKMNVKEIAKEYVIIENWRGCEKPLPCRTRILMVWQAWKDEQRHVKFSLTKDKNDRFRSGRHSKREESHHRCGGFLDKSSVDSNDPPQYKMSHDRKKQIRRSMQRFQQAVINQHSHDDIDGNNNADKQSSNTGEQSLFSAEERAKSFGQNVRDRPIVTLSEEQLVDGIVTGPECLLEDNLKSKFLRSAVNKGFNRERCNYRRPHHRRRSLLLEESDGVTDQNVVLTLPHKHDFHHYPFCNNSKRRSNSKRRRRRHDRRHRDRLSKHSHNENQQNERCSTDSTASTGSVSLPSDVEVIPYSEGEDADDEKSVMAEYSRPKPGQKLSPFPGSVLTCDERCCSGAGSASTATTTDSSSGNTTCSETSNTSSNFTTSSSETSSSGDVESYFAKRDAAAAAAKASAVEKSKGGASKLLRPAQTLISSFKKKKKPSSQVATQPKIVLSTGSNCNKLSTKATGLSLPKSTTPQCNQSLKNLELSALNQQKLNKEATKSSFSFNPSSKEGLTRMNERDRKEIEEIKKLILSREQIIKSQQNKEKVASSEIKRFEYQIQQSKSKTKENYQTQNIPQNSSLPQASNLFSSSTQWIRNCKDASVLEHYIASCEGVVAKQLKIEENKRNADILLQKLRDQVWNTPSGTESSKPNSISAVALGIMAEAENSSDEESESRTDTLSVSAGKRKAEKKQEESKKPEEQPGPLQVERTRTELEANLYLGLRLSTELEEVEKLMSASKHLLQIKGEALLHLVRDLAQSTDGISSDLWHEYGNLLAAYDDEISLQHYLTACAENDIAKQVQADGENGFYQSSHFAEIVNEIESNSSSDNALNHALSPWLWCAHCKEELEKSQKQGNLVPSTTPLSSSHWLTHTSAPLNLSALPLPNPLLTQTGGKTTSNNSRLLPMPSVGAFENDSDYDEFSAKNESRKAVATSTIISTEDAVPNSMILHLPRKPASEIQPISRPSPMNNFLSSSFRNSANTDDSGNASAESTASFASTSSDCTDLGSRNSSCDGGSPRPPSVTAESVDSAHSSPFFGRGNFKRSSGKSKFTFPSNFKPAKSEQIKKVTSEDQRPAFILKATPTRNNIPPGIKTIEEKNSTNHVRKLIRRNSSKTKKNNPIISEPFARKATSFGKGSVQAPAYSRPLNGILKKPVVCNDRVEISLKNTEIKQQREANFKKNDDMRNSDSTRHVTPLHMRSQLLTPHNQRSLTPTNVTKFTGRNLHPDSSSTTFAEIKSNNTVLDNDSDTGLSSLHSTESFDRLCPVAGESLV